MHVPPCPSPPASDRRRSTKRRTRFREAVRQVSPEEGRQLHMAPRQASGGGCVLDVGEDLPEEERIFEELKLTVLL